MEYENLPRSGLGPGMCGCDREIFERVWRRVMPEEPPGCPITLIKPEFNQRVQPVPEEEPSPMQFSPAPSPPGTQSPDSAIDYDYPKENDVPWFGCSSAIYGTQLQEYILRSLQGWRCYQLLSRRSPSSMSKQLARMAAEKRQQAKRLSTAYFLITGIHYFPAERVSAPSFTSFLGMLRSRFAIEQREASDLTAAAEETTDTALRDLYIDLANESTSRAGEIRSSLEVM